jgi:hypothetical protein
MLSSHPELTLNYPLAALARKQRGSLADAKPAR